MHALEKFRAMNDLRPNWRVGLTCPCPLCEAYREIERKECVAILTGRDPGDENDAKPVAAEDTKSATTRVFATGATRNNDASKYDYEGFLSPLVLEAYAAYMHVNRQLEDGSVRASDNWQKGIPREVYAKSGWRHFHDLWKAQRGIAPDEGELGASMGVLFNVMGWAFERMKADPNWLPRELERYKFYRAKELAARK